MKISIKFLPEASDVIFLAPPRKSHLKPTEWFPAEINTNENKISISWNKENCIHELREMPEIFPSSISNKNCHIFNTYFLLYKSSYSLIILIFRSTVIIRIKITNLMDLKSDVVGDEGQALDGLQTNQLDLIVEHVDL